MDRSAAFAQKIRSAFSSCSLGHWPTPLQLRADLARAVGRQALWLKREDVGGGNKVRGLEFLLADAPAGSVFVTIGGAGSSHCLATARAAHSLGHRAALALFPQPDTDASRDVSAAIDHAADVVVRASSHLTFPWALWRAARAARQLGARQPRWIPGGGADPRAVLGHFVAALELATQLDAPPEAIVVPLGTGGTAAGIVLGVAWLGWSTEVIAVRVASHLVANRWSTLRLARRTATLIQQAGLEFNAPRSGMRVRVVNALGRGYGYPTPEGERARAIAAEHGLRLDPTYGAKAFGVLLSPTYHAPRTVFWHTFAWP
ncbi:MAG TPA: pyridoxal-phosphate dependent enzyme [Gemmatimonadales bacterium]|nr:pyridoxal-phosphate dependent enzyme [Gemmatimonadales bacterium]